MKTKDKILKYIDNSLDENEKIQFEKELSNSEELQKQISNYSSFIKDIDKLKNVKFDESYFAETIPKFRSRQEISHRFLLFPRISLSLASVVSVALIFIFTVLIMNKKDYRQKSNSVIADKSVTNVSGLLDPSADQINLGFMTNEESAKFDSTLNIEMSKELDLSPKDLSYLSPDQSSDLSSLLQNINENDANDIYREVLNQKFFGRSSK